jgi:hypothetical protein
VAKNTSSGACTVAQASSRAASLVTDGSCPPDELGGCPSTTTVLGALSSQATMLLPTTSPSVLWPPGIDCTVPSRALFSFSTVKALSALAGAAAEVLVSNSLSTVSALHSLPWVPRYTAPVPVALPPKALLLPAAPSARLPMTPTSTAGSPQPPSSLVSARISAACLRFSTIQPGRLFHTAYSIDSQ